MATDFVSPTLACLIVIVHISVVCPERIFAGDAGNEVLECKYSFLLGFFLDVKLATGLSLDEVVIRIEVCKYSSVLDCRYGEATLSWVDGANLLSVNACTIDEINMVASCPSLTLSDVAKWILSPAPMVLIRAFKNMTTLDYILFMYSPSICDLVACSRRNFKPTLEKTMNRGITVLWTVPKPVVGHTANQTVYYRESGVANAVVLQCAIQAECACIDRPCECSIDIGTVSSPGLDPCRRYDVCVRNAPMGCSFPVDSGVSCVSNVSVEVSLQALSQQITCSYNKYMDQLNVSWQDLTSDVQYRGIYFRYGVLITARGPTLYENETSSRVVRMPLRSHVESLTKIRSVGVTVSRCLPCICSPGVQTECFLSDSEEQCTAHGATSSSASHIVVVVVFCCLYSVLIVALVAYVARKRRQRSADSSQGNIIDELELDLSVGFAYAAPDFRAEVSTSERNYETIPSPMPDEPGLVD